MEAKELILIGEYFHDWHEIVRPDLWFIELEKEPPKILKKSFIFAFAGAVFKQLWDHIVKEVKKEKDE